ncbi:hypothetical protein GL270_11075 [Aeromonas veronii]|uniref:hypothetical protein n=1 Tax=Aeromonas veronii TaxID=654 RepID=UPI001C5AE088|nr:hypothetical protein [Aeromonas veronii]MBW3781785.1 hypothetical protein [Aeromonas veronii]
MKKLGNKICLWIKEYTHPLQVTGGFMFFLALIFGIIWISGKDVEAVAFVLGLLSSLFFASPSIAEYFYPNRKPVRYMTFDELVNFIPTTDYKNDWHGISLDWTSERFLKEDPRLRIRAKYTDDGIQNEDFKDSWANNHPDSKAVGYWYDIFYDGAFIDRVLLVSVDGGRAVIPPPKFKTGNIERYEYSIAKIHDTLNSVDEYIERSGLTLAD